jgi:hypothetical protein
VADAAVLTVVAALAARLLPVDRALRMTARAALSRGTHAVPAPRLAVLVESVTFHLGAPCLVGAMVLHSLLACRGEPSEVVIGAARDAGSFRAHAWVERCGDLLSVQGPDGCTPLCRLSAGSAAAARVP